MPGVVLTTSVRSGPVGTSVAPAGSFFVAGVAQRGPVSAFREVTSIADFESYFGERLTTSNLWDTVNTFFEEGGARAYVARTDGVSSVTGVKTFEGALIFTAQGPGSWSGNMFAKVTTASALSSVKIYYPDNTTLVYESASYATNLEIVTAVNASATASRYVVAALGASSPSTLATTTGAVAFSAGSSGTTPTLAKHTAAIDLFVDSLGAGAVAFADYYNTDGHQVLLTHGYTNNRIAILQADSSVVTSAAIITIATSDAALDYAEYGALYYPWVKVPDGVFATGTRSIPPCGYVAAKRSKVHTDTGAWAPAAGLASKASFVNGVDVEVGRTAGDALNAANVNAIRTIQGSVRIYGARSVSSDSADFKFITSRDSINYITVAAKTSLEDLVFGVLDGRNAIFSEIASRLTGIIEPIRLAGGLYEAFTQNGARVDYGYTVKCDSSLNSPTQLADGIIKARVGLRVSSIGELIQVDILKSNISGSLS